MPVAVRFVSGATGFVAQDREPSPIWFRKKRLFFAFSENLNFLSPLTQQRLQLIRHLRILSPQIPRLSHIPLHIRKKHRILASQWLFTVGSPIMHNPIQH
jgi:hypothetical protein